jgi:hypothetical protein
MKRVIIESPFSDGGDMDKRRLFDAYLKLCIKNSLSRGEAPFASHGFYTRVLDDNNSTERRQGMEAGFAWGQTAEIVAVYEDLGISPGMEESINRALKTSANITFRSLFGNFKFSETNKGGSSHRKFESREEILAEVKKILDI